MENYSNFPNLRVFQNETEITPLWLFLLDLQLHFRLFYHENLSLKLLENRYGYKLFLKVHLIAIHYHTLSMQIRERIRMNGYATHGRCPNFPPGVFPEDLRTSNLLPPLPLMDGCFIGLSKCFKPIKAIESNDGNHDDNLRQSEGDVIVESEVIKESGISKNTNITKKVYSYQFFKNYKRIDHKLFKLDFEQFISERFENETEQVKIFNNYTTHLWLDNLAEWLSYYRQKSRGVRKEVLRKGKSTYFGSSLFLNQYAKYIIDFIKQDPDILHSKLMKT